MRFLLISLAALLIAIAGVGAYYLQQQAGQYTQQSATNTPKPAEPTIKVPTHSAQTEGKTIQVPNNVAPSSVQNYELITENENYKIRRLDGTYTITLYAIVNGPNQSPTYTEQLITYKHAALNYMTSHGINVNKENIVYDPAEAAQL